MDTITLATLAQATPQQVFDQVARHLLTQNAKSVDLISGQACCKYRDRNGNKCAAGCLISDDEYRDSFDSKVGGWSSMVVQRKAPATHADLIVCLQRVHDGGTPATWPADLIDAAKTHNLDPAVVFELAEEG